MEQRSTMAASDEANKIETVLNNSLQVKIPGYVLNRSKNARDIIIIVSDDKQKIVQQREGSDGRDRQTCL